MAGAVELVLFAGVLGVHTLVAAVMTRFFRVVLDTRLGSAVFTGFFVPVVLLFSTLFFTGILKIGPDLGGAYAALAVMIGAPLVLGVTVDLLYVPSPDEYELPDTAD